MTYITASPADRERAERETSELAEACSRRFVVALFINPDKPQLVGSGFFVQDGGREFLVSAAHVFDEFESAYYSDRGIPPDLFVYTDRGEVRNLGGRLLRPRANSPHRRYDIGVLQLGGEPIAWGSERRESVPLDVVRRYLTLEPKEQLFLLAGYPESRARASSHPTKRLDAKPHGMVGPAVHDARYDPREFVLMEFDQEKDVTFYGDKTPRRFPNPRGMSGSPIWALHYDVDWHPTAVVVGVTIAQDKKNRMVIGSRILPAIAMIDSLLAGGALDPAPAG